MAECNSGHLAGDFQIFYLGFIAHVGVQIPASGDFFPTFRGARQLSSATCNVLIFLL